MLNHEDAKTIAIDELAQILEKIAKTAVEASIMSTEKHVIEKLNELTPLLKYSVQVIASTF